MPDYLQVQIDDQTDRNLLLSSLNESFPAMHELLTCDPNQLFTTIKKMNALPKHTWDIKDNFQQNILASIKEELNGRFKQITEWNFDHVELFNNMLIFHMSFPIYIQTLYKAFLLNKIKNGLQYTSVLEILEQLSVKSDKKQKATNEDVQIYLKSLSDTFKATMIKKAHQVQESSIYFERYNCLGHEQKLLYHLKLVHLIQNSHEMSMMKIKNCIKGIDEELEHLGTWIIKNQKVQLFEELIKIQCTFLVKYEKSIIQAEIIVVDKQETKVTLKSIEKIEDMLLTSKILKALLKKHICVSALADINVFHFNNNVYLKFGVTELGQIRKQIKKKYESSSEFRWKDTQLKQIFDQAISNLALIMTAITQGKSCLSYETGGFNQIPREQYVNLIIFCLQEILKIRNLKQITLFYNTIAEIFTQPKLIRLFTDVLEYVQNETTSQISTISTVFVIVCDLLQHADISRKQEMQRLNSFNDQFIKNLNILVENNQIKGFVSVQICLMDFIVKIPDNHNKIKQINLQKLYEVKYKNQVKQDLFYCTIQQFIVAFPDSQAYFTQKFQEDLLAEMNRLQKIQPRPESKSSLLNYMLKMFQQINQQKKQVSDKIKQLYWQTVFKNPYIFYQSSSQFQRQDLNSTLKIERQAIRAELSKSYNEFISLVANHKKDSKSSYVAKANSEIMHDFNVLSSLLILIEIQDQPLQLQTIPQIIKIVISSNQLYCKMFDQIFLFEANRQEYPKQEKLRKKFEMLWKAKEILEAIVVLCKQNIAVTSNEISIVIKQWSNLFVALKNSSHKYFTYFLLNLFQDIITKSSDFVQYHIGFQLYNHNHQLIHEALRNIYRQIQLPKQPTVLQKIDLSNPIYNVLEQCLEAGKDPIVEFDKLLCQTLRKKLEKITTHIFNARSSKCTFNSRLYIGWQKIKKIQKTVICDITTKMANSFQVEDVNYCFSVLFFEPIDKKDDSVRQNQLVFDMEIPDEPIKIQSQEDYKNQMANNYKSILSKTDKYKYNQSLLKRMQQIYILIFNRLKHNHGHQNPVKLLTQNIIQEIESIGKEVRTNAEVLIKQFSWIAKLQNKVSITGLQKYVTVQFILIFMKITSLLIQDPARYQQQLTNSVSILSKFIPKAINEQYKTTVIAFTRRLIQLIVNILNQKEINPNPRHYKNVFRSTTLQIIEAIKHLKCPQLFQQMHNLIFLELKNNCPIQNIICHVVDQQMCLLLIEADIKGIFMKQSLKNKNKSNEIQMPLSYFLKVFQAKYQEDVAGFSDIARKILKKTKKTSKDKEEIFLSYNISQPFNLGLIHEKDFGFYQPPVQMKTILKDLLNACKSMKIIQFIDLLDYLKVLFYRHHLLIPYVFMHPVSTQNSNKQTFLEFFLSLQSTTKNNCEFLRYSCLEHRHPIKTKKQTTFFNSILCAKIISHIIRQGIDDQNLMIIHHLITINRFAYLSKIKLNIKDHRSLLDLLIDYTKNLLEQEFTLEDRQTKICKIFACIYKQVQYGENMKILTVSKLPAYSFEENCGFQQRQLSKLINSFFQNQSDLYLQTAEDLSSFAENFMNPMYSEDKQFFLEDFDQEINFNYEINQEQINEQKSFQLKKIDQDDKRALAEIVNSYQLQIQKPIKEKSKKAQDKTSQKQMEASRYAQSDFSTGTAQVGNSQLQLSLITLEDMITQQNTGEHFQREFVQDKIRRLNERLLEINQQPIKMSDYSNLNEIQLNEWLLDKQNQVDFDQNKHNLSPAQFDQYLLANSMKLERLKSKRKQELQLTEDIMFTSHISKNFSTDSISYMIDTIDQNYQHFSTTQRTKQEEFIAIQNKDTTSQKLQFKINDCCLHDIIFPDVSEHVIFQMMLSFYIKTFGVRFQILPFLENKKIQSKFITTLLYLMKDPYNSHIFPEYNSQVAEKYKIYIRDIIDSDEQEEQKIKVIKRILFTLGLAKEYTYYRTDFFFKQEIANEGFFGVTYDHERLGDRYIPIYQIISLSIKYVINCSPIFMKNVEGLPESVITEFYNFITNKLQYEQHKQGSKDYEILYNLMSPIDQYSPFACFQEIYSNECFKKRLKEQYSFEAKQPPMFLLPYLVQSNIYSISDLKAFHLKLLAENDQSYPSLMFKNKVMSLYDDQELKQITWLKQYQEAIRNVFNVLNQKKIEIKKQPICQLLKFDNETSFGLKKMLFQFDLQLVKAKKNYKKEAIQSKRAKGILQSAFQDLRYKPGGFWLSDFTVQFVNANGVIESGQGSGIIREWLTLLSKAIVNPDYLLFSRTPKNSYFFSRQSSLNPRHLQYFEFFGKLFALALVKGMPLSPSFSLLLYKLFLSQEITIEDILQEFQEEGKCVMGIQRLIENSFCDEDVLNADLTFTYPEKRLISTVNYSLLADNEKNKVIGKRVEFYSTEDEVLMDLHSEKDKKILPETIEIIKVIDIHELKPGGTDIRVTFDNIHQYLSLIKQKIHEIVIGSIKKQLQAFMQGFSQVINPTMLRLFTSKEMKVMAEGVNDISIADLKEYTKNNGVDQITEQHFWAALEELSNEDRALFLWNWTGVDKVPVEGAKIMKLGLGKAFGKFIVAHICYNKIQLPFCQTKKEMEAAVSIVINNVKTGHAIIED